MRKKLEPAPTPTPTARSSNSKSSALCSHLQLWVFPFLASSIEANGEHLQLWGEKQWERGMGWQWRLFIRGLGFPYQIANESERGLRLQTFYWVIFNSDRFDSFSKIRQKFILSDIMQSFKNIRGKIQYFRRNKFHGKYSVRNIYFFLV